MRSAFAFLTPFGRSSTPTPSTLAWFPTVGGVVGLAVGVVWWLSARAWPPLVAGALAVVADLALTGFLHFDGVADAADGLLAPMTKERRLAAMADPAIGAFGALAVGAVLLVRWSSLAAQLPAPLVVAGLWCASRTAMAVVTLTMPYARPGGLAEAFVHREAGDDTGDERTLIASAVVAGAVASVGLVVLARGVAGLAALGAELAAFAAVVLLARRRLGGFTGDVLGAAGVVGETIGLLILAAR